MTDPWDVVDIPIHEWLIVIVNAGKYTKNIKNNTWIQYILSVCKYLFFCIYTYIYIHTISTQRVFFQGQISATFNSCHAAVEMALQFTLIVSDGKRERTKNQLSKRW